MTFDDPLHRSKAHPRTFELVPAMKPLKNAEKLVVIPHVETRPRVLDEKNRFRVVDRASEMDRSIRRIL